MKKKLFVIMFICNILSANAKDDYASEKENIYELKLTIKIDSADLHEKLSLIKGVIKVEFDINSQVVVIEYDNKEKGVREKIDLQCGKVNAKLVEDIKSVQEFVAVEQIKFKPEIDKFLNTEDESIFSDEKIIILTEREINEQMHPRSKDYYLLIYDIYNLKKLLDEVSKLSFGQKQQAKDKLSQASNIINNIGNTDKCYKDHLSKQQKDFYKNLVDNEFNRLYSDL